jgi:hypothetical protein
MCDRMAEVTRINGWILRDFPIEIGCLENGGNPSTDKKSSEFFNS